MSDATSRASTPAAAGSATTIPAMITAQPSQPSGAEPVARERERRRAPPRPARARTRAPSASRSRAAAPRSARGTRARSRRRPSRAARPRPSSRAARCSWPSASAIASRPANDGEHLDERERERVVARRVALHQRRSGARRRPRPRARAGRRRRAAVDPGEQREPDRRERDADPRRRADRARKSASARSGVSTTYIPVMKPVVETDRALEPRGLQRVAGAEQRAGSAAAASPPRPSVRSAARAGRRERALEIANRRARNANSG